MNHLDYKVFFSGKRVMVIVAHHDDEVFAFGALLASVFKLLGALVIVAMSDLRPDSFREVCNALKAESVTIQNKKYQKSDSYYVEDIIKNSEEIKKQIDIYKPEIIITHSNRIDGSHYHPFHIIINLAVKHAVNNSLPIVVRSQYGDSKFCVKSGKKTIGLFKMYNSQKWLNIANEEQSFDILEAQS